jgi:hypothetical protein
VGKSIGQKWSQNPAILAHRNNRAMLHICFNKNKKRKIYIKISHFGRFFGETVAVGFRLEFGSPLEYL